MKTLALSVRTLALIGVPLVIFLSAQSVSAKLGVGAGGGGDMCEKRFKEVRDDIEWWIRRGGYRHLKISPNIMRGYKQAMLNVIAKAKISCTDEKIYVGTAEKTCRGDWIAGQPYIQCNIARFMNTDESDQYVQDHHEYAVLSGVEVNNYDDSKYGVSDQISGFLEEKVVKKLAIVPRKPQDPNTIHVDGVRVAPLFELGEKLDLVTHAMAGRADLDLQGVVCRKIVDEVHSRVTCSIEKSESGQRETIALTTDIEEQKDIANELRHLLTDLSRAEKRISATEKRLELKSVFCHVAGVGFEWDDVEFEPTYKCVIKVK
jgi:hypothetical protein